LVLAVFFVVLFSGCLILKDKAALQNNLIRLHVIANSDSDQDQAIKLQVKDAVVAYLNEATMGTTDVAQAKEILSYHLPEIEAVANAALKSAGSAHTATATITLEEYDTREYETFSLPAGVYQSLQIKIGEATGKNWWCVAFPALCIPRTAKEFADQAVSSGFDRELTESLMNESKFNFRFYLLDCIGKLENMFRFG